MDEQMRTASPERRRQRSNGLLGIGLAVLFAAGAFFSGVHIGGANAPDAPMEANIFSIFASKPPASEEVDLTEFWRVWELMDDKFVVSSSSAELTEAERIEGAISGLLRTFDDPYTVYLPPREAEQLEQDISGNFGGVGMEVGMRDSLITVISPLPDTPAESAGLLAGDVIIEIDGESTEHMGIDASVQRIRGEVGSTVSLKIFREGEVEFLNIDVVRDTISIPTIDTEVVGDVFVITLYNFNALSEMKMQEALREYISSGQSKLVLDLRGNPGGFLQSAISIASYFLPTGKVVVREGFGDGSEELYRSTGKTMREFAPDEMVILINRGSASASEILAGALAEHDVATLIGETTFGKGSVQELISLQSGSSLKVTVARWFTPDGTSISDGGLDPDIFVDRTVEQFLADEDPQLDAAVEWLNGNKDVGTTTKAALIFDENSEL